MNNSAPNQIQNTLTIALFEVKKILFNTRGLIAIAAFALVWLLILLYPIKDASDYLLDPSFRQLLINLFGENSLDQLFSWKVAEMAIFWVIALFIFPLFSISVAADQFASDKSRGAFRFLTLRTSRDSLYFGRFCGSLLIQSILVLITVVATILLSVSRDPSLFLPALSSGLLASINIIIVLMPYTALMGILSLYANSSKQATIYAVLLWAILFIISSFFSDHPSVIAALQWVLPGAQISQMINTHGIGSFAFAPMPLLQTLVLLTLGRLYMKRSAI